MKGGWFFVQERGTRPDCILAGTARWSRQHGFGEDPAPCRGRSLWRVLNMAAELQGVVNRGGLEGGNNEMVTHG